MPMTRPSGIGWVASTVTRAIATPSLRAIPAAFRDALDVERGRRWMTNLPWLAARLGSAGGGCAVGVLYFWLIWERFAIWRAGQQHVQPDSILLYSVAAYDGEPRTLRDGTVVQRGDPIVMLHFDNRALLRRSTSQEWPPWSAVRYAGDDLDELARLSRDGELGGAVALHGVTYLAAAGRRLRFEVVPLPRTWGVRFLHYYLVGLAAVYHPHGWQGVQYLREKGWPIELWLSTGALQQRLSRAQEAPATRPPAR
ncbi:MAG: hypothetical protein IT305_28970 [Chloroflexi bacterium]|nr:hypothetical protein [Chloroflexota bacterium]